MVGSCSDHGRILLGSWSDRSRIVNDVSVTRAASRIVNNVSYVMWINHESFFVAGAVLAEVGG